MVVSDTRWFLTRGIIINMICKDNVSNMRQFLCFGWGFPVFIQWFYTIYTTSRKICTRFCRASFYFGPVIVLHWYWNNHIIAPVPVKRPWTWWVNAFCKNPPSKYNHKKWAVYIWFLVCTLCCPNTCVLYRVGYTRYLIRGVHAECG